MYEPDSKADSAEWKFPKEKPNLKSLVPNNTSSVMLSVFRDTHGIIVVDAAANQTLNSAYYGNILIQARPRRRKTTCRIWELEDTIHICILRKWSTGALFKKSWFLKKSRIGSKWLFLVTSLKMHLRGNTFEIPEQLKTVQPFFDSTLQSWFLSTSDQLVIYWVFSFVIRPQKEGSYIEKYFLHISRPIQSSDLKCFLILSYLLPITESWVTGSSTISYLTQKVGIIATALNFHLKTLWVSKTICAKNFF